MKQNSPCSILFHLLVPGGKWHTCKDNSNLSANSCKTTFHKRLRLLSMSLTGIDPPCPARPAAAFSAAPTATTWKEELPASPSKVGQFS